MASKPYKVRTAKNSKKKTGIFKNPKNQRLIAAIVGVYLVAGGILSLFLFSSNNTPVSKASEPATVTSSIRFLKEKKFKVGDQVEVLLTIQNTSVTEEITSLELKMLSTQRSVRWNYLDSPSNPSLGNLTGLDNSFELSDLMAGERVEYRLAGDLLRGDLDYLTVMGEITYTNSISTEEIPTNRIFTNLNGQVSTNTQPLILSVNAESFAPGEEIVLTLNQSEDIIGRGKIYISNRETGEVATSYDCIIEESDCSFNFNNLGSGLYSAMYSDSENQITSTIVWFEVTGQAVDGKLIPNQQATLNFPFDSGSINGYVPVIANRILSRNDSIFNQPPCVFEVLSGEQVVYSTTAEIDQERSCQTEIYTSLLPSEGVYTVRLANTTLSRDISFLAKSDDLLKLENQSPDLLKGQDITVSLSEILDVEGEPLAQEKVNLYIYHKNSGQISKINQVNGSELLVIEGKFETNIDASYFDNSGNYLIYAELGDERLTDFISLNLDDNDIAFSKTGVIIEDYSLLTVDSNVPFRVEGITDKDGRILEKGVCSAQVYTTAGGTLPTEVGGLIENGVCTAILPPGTVQKSGPALVSFSTGTVSSINQTRQINLRPGIAASYGEINFSYEPVIQNYANEVIIGPVLDTYGNYTNSKNHRLSLTDSEGQIIADISPVEVVEGFAKIFIPASYLREENITIKLHQEDGVEILVRNISPQTDEGQTLKKPNFPSQFSNSKDISVNITGLKEEGVTNCLLRVVRSAENYLDQEAVYNDVEDYCQIDWALTEERSKPKLLLQLISGEYKFSRIIELTPDEASNLFVIKPQVKFNSGQDLEISLLSSPIVDKYGLVIDQENLKWTYNGKIKETRILNGFGKVDLLAGDLEARDITSNFDQRALDLDLSVEASPVSINQTNNIQVYLGNYDIATQLEEFNIISGSSYVTSNTAKILEFEGLSCQAFNLNTSLRLFSHLQGDKCFVQAAGDVGQNSIIFEDQGYTKERFDFNVGLENQDIDWCIGDTDKCDMIQILGPVGSEIEVIIHDEANKFTFTSEELENTVSFSQNGLNPLKEYLVEVRYKSLDGTLVSHYKTILGEKLGI